VTISDHALNFAYKPIEDWEAGTPLTDPTEKIYKITLDYDDSEKDVRWTDLFAQFLQDPQAAKVTGIVIGMWGTTTSEAETADQVVQALVAAREKLPALTAIFMGDITYEECEISWINQTDISPLLEAYPALEHFRVRGGNGLNLGRLHHDHLKSLIVETGGLNVAVVREVMGAQLPELEHLELWLGTDGYGANSTVQDLAALFAGTLFPKLRYLGLRDSDIANDIAIELAKSPILERIRVLDLSLGILDDRGAEALLNNPALARLEKLDIHHHYCSEAMVKRLEALPIAVNTEDRQDPHRYGDDEEWRYVAVGE
jgi:hypothetical protein